MPAMKTFDDNSSYKGGEYLISLRRPAHWYMKRVQGKGKSYCDSNIDIIFPILIDKIFGQEIDKLDDIELAFNMDCIVQKEAEYVQKELEYRILAEIMAFFPKIGAYLPDYYYRLAGSMDLVITVPDRYEAQRGYFF